MSAMMPEGVAISEIDHDRRCRWLQLCDNARPCPDAHASPLAAIQRPMAKLRRLPPI
jgi:hypothetical protein